MAAMSTCAGFSCSQEQDNDSESLIPLIQLISQKHMAQFSRTCCEIQSLAQWRLLRGLSDESRGVTKKQCGRAVSGTAVRTALINYGIHSGLYTGTVHSVQQCQSTEYCCHAGAGWGPGAQTASTVGLLYRKRSFAFILIVSSRHLYWKLVKRFEVI